MMTDEYLIAFLNTGWEVKRTGVKSEFYRIKLGDMGGRHLVDRSQVLRMINQGKLEFVNPKTQLTVRIKK